MQLYVDPLRRRPNFDRVKDGNFIVRWLHLHAFVNIVRSLWRPIQQSDLFNLSRDYWPETNIGRFRAIKRQHPVLWLLQLMFRYFLFWGYLWAGVLAIVGAALELTGPIAIKEIVTFLAEDEDNHEARHGAKTFAGILVGAYFIRIFIVEFSNRLFFMLSLKTHQILNFQLLSKISRMSFDKKMKTQKVYLANHMIIDCKFVSSLVSCSGRLFSVPVKLIMVQILLFAEVEFYAFAFTLSFLLGLYLQFLIDRKITRKESQRLGVIRQKSGMNYEFIQSIKQIQLLGWQQLIINKNKQFRDKENLLNNRIYKLSGFFDLVAGLIPIVTVAMILLFYSGTHDEIIDPVVIFTVISYCSLISNLNDLYEPIEGFRALNRIENQLKAEEYVPTETHDKGLTGGKVVLSSLVARWKFEGVAVTDLEDTKLLEREEFNFETEESEEEQTGEEKEGYFEESRGQLLEVSSEEGGLNQTLLQKRPLRSIIQQQLQPKSSLKINQKPKFNQLEIPSDFVFEKSRLIILGDVQSGKSSLLHAIMGNLSILEGSAKYGGRVGYMPQNIWLKQSSVRNNVLFGTQLDNNWLKTVYEWLDLRSELKMFDKGDQTLVSQNLFMTEKQRKKIALARAIYCRPDVLILDEPFLFLDIDESKLLYNRISKEFQDRVVIIATKTPEFVNAEDDILVIDQGKIVESGKYSEINGNGKSLIHKIYRPEESKINIVSTQLKELTLVQRRARVKRLNQLRQKLRNFLKRLLDITRGKSREQVDQVLAQKSLPLGDSSLVQLQQQFNHRVTRIKTEYLRRLFFIYPSFYILLVLISIVVQSLVVYSIYWIGSDELPYNITYKTQLTIYLVLTFFMCLVRFLSGFVAPRLSFQVVDNIISKATSALVYTGQQKWRRQGYLLPTLLLNKDIENYFLLNSCIQRIIYGIVTFLISVILIGISSPIFYAVGVSIGVLYGIARHYLLRAQREMYNFRYYQLPINQTYQETIVGAETLKAFGRMEEHIEGLRETLYNHSVFLANHQFIFHGISIVCKLLGLGVLAGAVFFAISAKGRLSDYSVGLLGASISFILDLSETLTNIIGQSVELYNTLTDTIKEDFETIDESNDDSYFRPEPPSGWPQDGSLQYINAYLTNSLFDQPVIKNLSLKVESGESLALFGKDDIGKLAAIYALVGQYNNTNQTGAVLVGKHPVQSIGRKFLVDQIRILTSDPFIFRGSVRQNVDPFNEYEDERIVEVLKRTKAWKRIKVEGSGGGTTEDRLKMVFTEKSKYDLLQRINISRVLLKNPKVIVFTSITDSLSRKTSTFLENLLLEEFKGTTKIFMSQNKDTILKADKIAFVEKGKLKDFGTPKEILDKDYKVTSTRHQQKDVKKELNISESQKTVDQHPTNINQSSASST